jgi:predicted AlkP superfamily pyrophosphatase or phosphodiesterase
MQVNLPRRITQAFARTSVATAGLVAILMLFATTLTPRALGAQEPAHHETPRLAVGIMVDQMRYDFIYRFWHLYGEGGFKRLLNRGFSFDNAQFGYLPTYTGPGHASVYTGTTPAVHGIIGNDWYLRDQGRTTYVTEDRRQRTLGSASDAGQMSPHWMLSTTIGDELRLHTNMRSKVVGISLKDRGSILPAGHTGQAYWFDESTGDFITSTYYHPELPRWVADFNARRLVDRYLSRPWETLLPIEQYRESLPDDNPYEGTFAGQDRPVFPHDLPRIREAAGPGVVVYTPFGDELVIEMAIAALEAEQLGRNQVPDLLAISFSTPDYVGHQFGPASIEVQDVYLRLDRQLSRFLAHLDGTVGSGNYVVFLTSDHGAAHVPAHMRDLGIPAGTFREGAAAREVRGHLTARFGEDLLESFTNQQFFLRRDRVGALGLDVKAVREELMEYVLAMEGVAGALPAHALVLGEYTDGIRRLIQRGYNQKRSGDVMIWYEPQWFTHRPTGTTHGSGHSYDTRAPLLWYGWGIPAGRTTEPVFISDIASTLAIILNTPFPNGNTGRPMNHHMTR